MDENQMVDDIVAMLDGSVARGDGHVNIKIDENGKIDKEVKTGCADCSINPMACSVPTIFLDGDDEM